MKAVICAGAGDVSVMHIGDAPQPELGDGQIRIAVRERRQPGGHPSAERPLSAACRRKQYSRIGSSRRSARSRQALRGWRVGDRVMALVGGGGYAAEVCVDAKLAMPLPANLSYQQGAAIPEAFITAHLNLFTLGHAIAESTVLVHAGASGVGTAAIQMLRRIGARVFATVGSAEKAEAITALGGSSHYLPRSEFRRDHPARNRRARRRYHS